MIKFIKNIKSEFEENHKIADNVFSIIILFVSFTSFFHVMEYWTLTNKAPFHIVTAIATELFIIGSMFAIRYTWTAWIPFIFGFIVQSVGNIFYSYINIDVNSIYFQSFTELFQPSFELAYGDELVILNYKRFLAIANGLFYLSPIVFLITKLKLREKVAKEAKSTPPVSDIIDKNITPPPPPPTDGTPEPKPDQEVNELTPSEEVAEDPVIEQPVTVESSVDEPVETPVVEIPAVEEPAVEEKTAKAAKTPSNQMSFDPVYEQERKKKVEQQSQQPLEKIDEVPSEPTATEVWLDILHEVAGNEGERVRNQPVTQSVDKSSSEPTGTEVWLGIIHEVSDSDVADKRNKKKVSRQNQNPYGVGTDMHLIGLKRDAKYSI